jgi:hypothetical protein
MSVRFDTPVALIVIWAGLLIVFVVMRPRPYSLSFWLLVGSAMLSGGLYSLTSHMESKRVKRATLAWLQQVNELVDVRDFQNDGHLPEYLDESERRRVVEEHKVRRSRIHFGAE